MMPTAPLRRLVGALALTISITTAIVVPAGYFAIEYSNSAETLSFKARLNAAKVAQYIYSHDAMWQYQQLRLGELIQFPKAGERPISQ